MSKDIKKALEHCAEWNCDNCPNREELGSGEIVCRGRLLTEVLEYVSDLQSQLAITEKAFELACDKIADMLTQNGGAWFYDFDSDTVIERNGFENFYKRYAKEMFENE